jgi:23S rRNA pseudouridine2605 synthase
MTEPAVKEGERIAKRLARAGLCSRRDAERWIAEGRVKVDGELLKTPACVVTSRSRIEVDGKPLPDADRARLWRYHKPVGELVTARDPQGRPTIFDALPKGMPRTIAVGRLDFMSEGLLLLTNDGELARKLELPANGWTRRYRARVHGAVDEAKLASLKKGITVDGVHYGPIEASLDRQQRSNAWLNVALTEGKNREVRKVLAHLGLPVVRLIRVAFGPIHLGELPAAQVDEVPSQALATLLGVAQKRGEGWAKPKPRSSSRGPKQAHHRRQR